MLDFLAALWFGVIGACIGSFLNVVAYRMPRGMSVVWKPSHCPRCGHNIRARDNIPVLGWLLLRGRCRDCGGPIAPRYAIVEGLMGAAFAVLAYVELLSGGANLPGGPLVPDYSAAALIARPDWPLIGLFAYHAILLSLVMAIVLIELDGQRAPTSFVAAAAVLVAIASTHHAAWYPELGFPGTAEKLSAPGAALAGAAFGVIPWIAAWNFARQRQTADRVREFLNLGAEIALIGGFLGALPAVRIIIAQAIAIVIGRALSQSRARQWPFFAAGWPLTLVHIAAWKQIAALVNW
jgi:prepilin signal peptidase PulO-like enzyme (type II secretory pathway)